MINNKPIIGIPIGDPAGVGPEIVVKSLTEAEIYEKCNPILIGDAKVIKQAMGFCNVNLNINSIKKVDEGKFTLGTIDLIDLNNIDIDELKIGKVQGIAGKAAFEYIKKSVEMAKEGELDAIATTPINKESLREGNVNYIGHTEILADLTDTEDPLTMFEVRGMRVFFLTRHVSLRKACDLVTKERVLDYIIRCSEALEN